MAEETYLRNEIPKCRVTLNWIMFSNEKKVERRDGVRQNSDTMAVAGGLNRMFQTPMKSNYVLTF